MVSMTTPAKDTAPEPAVIVTEVAGLVSTPLRCR
jgi:hypothetical protein